MDAATDPADQWHVLPCVHRRRALAPHSISAATGRCDVSSPTPMVLAASFVSMVANLRLKTHENSADAVAKEQSTT